MSKHKLLLILSIPIVIVIVIVVFNLYQKNFAEIKPLPRPSNEPVYLKGVNIVPYEVKNFEETVNKIRATGVNIVVINLDLVIGDDGNFSVSTGPPDLDIQRQIAKIITEAHSQDLQVELRTVTGNPEFEREGRLEYEEILQASKEYVTTWAQFSQRYDVYQFTPFGEVNSFRTKCTSDFESQVASFSKEILADIQKHYKGRVGMGFLPPDGVLDYDLSGYDYIEISIYIHSDNPYTSYEEGFLSMFENAQPLLRKSKISHLIMGETGIADESVIGDLRFGIEVTNETEDSYYEALFQTLSPELDGMYVGYDVESQGLRVSNNDTKQKIRSWFSRL